jgi:hypothetical protein
VNGWERDGYFVLRAFATPYECARLREACDVVLARMLAERESGRDATNIAFLTQRRYFAADLAPLALLLRWIASRRIRDALEPLGEGPLLFFNTQYFHEQGSRTWDGPWHRDTQFESKDAEEEQALMRGSTAVHFRIACEPDERLELVPGSHHRWDSPDELAIRRGEEPARSDMPGRVQIALGRGDACVFHAWMIHRGTYGPEPVRRTFDVLYTVGPPTRFGEPASAETLRDAEVRSRLDPAELAFYDAFLAAYDRET